MKRTRMMYALPALVVLLGLCGGCQSNEIKDRIKQRTRDPFSQIGYDAGTHALTLQFRDGPTHTYNGVPEDIYGRLQRARDRGAYYTNSILGHYEPAIAP